MNSPDTLKDTCPHRVQCSTAEECNAKSTNDTHHAATLGERLVRLALEDMGPTRARQVVAVVKVPGTYANGAPSVSWRYTASYSAEDRARSITGHADTRAAAWQAVHTWMLYQLSDDAELPGTPVPPPDATLQKPTAPDFAPGAPLFSEVEAALKRHGMGLTQESWSRWSDYERTRVLAWARAVPSLTVTGLEYAPPRPACLDEDWDGGSGC